MVGSHVFSTMTLVAVVAMGVVPATAQTAVDSNAPRTLSEYLRYAAIHNPGLKAAFENWKVTLEQIPQAKTLPDPKFTYGYFIEKMDTRQRAGIMQEFPWFGTIEARTDAATAAVKAAQRRYEAARLQLSAQVKSVFYEYAYLSGATRITSESVELMKHFEEVARTKYITSSATHPDIIRAQIQVAELQDRLVTLERLRDPIVGRIDAVLSRKTETSLPWPDAEPTRVADVDRAKLLAILKETNPQLQAAGFDIERRSSEVNIAKRKYYPNIGVGVEWMDMDNDAMPDTIENDEVVLGVQLNLPIWRRSYRAGEQQARAAVRRARYEREQLENDLVSQAERTLYEFDDSGRKLRLYEDVLVPKAEELLGASEAAYTAGTVDFLSLIDAQQTLLQYRLQRERAYANCQQRLAELEMLAGTELPMPPASTGSH